MTGRLVRFDRDLLKRLRVGNRMTLRDLASATGLSNPYLSQLERGHTDDPGIEALSRIAAVFRLSIDTFIVQRVTVHPGPRKSRRP